MLKDLDVKNIDDLVKFFQRLLAERTKKDEGEQAALHDSCNWG